MSFITRFAPSPTGYLHLGHAISALGVWQAAEQNDGSALLRIEDIDAARCRPDYEQGILDDLAWLGLTWPEPVWRQSTRLDIYRMALDELKQRDLVYPCFCTRREIIAAGAEPGFEGPVYPGTCRMLPRDEALARIRDGEVAAWRLDMHAALAEVGAVVWRDAHAGPQHWDGLGWGDVVLARKDIGTSYHMAVVIDDAAQGVTDIIRGTDLFSATHIHVVLQRLLALPTPAYAHHPVLHDADGDKLAKSRRSESLRDLIDAGLTTEDVVARADQVFAMNRRNLKLPPVPAAPDV